MALVSPFDAVDAASPNGEHTLAVEFRSRMDPYTRGDVASFPASMARRLVNSGVARAVNIAVSGPIPPSGRLALRYPLSADERKARAER